MKKLSSAVLALVFLAMNLGLAYAHRTTGGRPPQAVHHKNGVANANLPKPGQKAHPLGTRSTTRKLFTHVKPTHKHQTASNQQ